jgi:hypothetical protein
MGCLKLTYYQSKPQLKVEYRKHEPQEKAVQRWLNVDPASDKFANISPYNYCTWNPLIVVDPDGKEPSKDQVVGRRKYISIIRNKNITSISQLADLHKSANFGSEAGGNKERYLYSSKWGWVDMKHFSAAASQASSWWFSPERAVDLGEANELIQEKTGSASAWDYEDLTSNLLGAAFYTYLQTDEAQNKPFSTNLNDFLDDLGFTDYPKTAENYNKIPDTQNDKAMGPLNYTYEPSYAPNSDKRTSKMDEFVLDFLNNYLEEFGNGQHQDRRQWQKDF